jgi:hypothetical protein
MQRGAAVTRVARPGRRMRCVMKAASLSLVLLTVFSPAQSRLSAQTLSDVEISAGYCLGVLDTLIRASQAFEKSHRMEEISKGMEEISKEIWKYQEI